MTLYAFGTDPLYYHTQSAVARSTDLGSTWQRLPSPFPVHVSCASAAVNSAGDWVVMSGSGSAAHTSDPTVDSWSTYDINNTFTNLRKVIHNNGKFIAVGVRKDPITLEEVAVIQTSTTGINEAAWSINSLSSYEHSGLTDVIHLEGSTLLAVGYKSGQTASLILKSVDNGVTWSELIINSIQGAIWCAARRGTRLWLGGAGVVFTTANWNTPSPIYASSNPLLMNGVAKPITKLYSATSCVVACQSAQIWYTNTDYDWRASAQDGHTFTTAIESGSKICLGTSSLLNQHTGFTTTAELRTDTPAELTGFNMGIHVFEFLTV